MKIVIKRNLSDEYEVPTAPWPNVSDSIYYTDDADDALDTAKLNHGEGFEFKFERGTYSPEGA